MLKNGRADKSQIFFNLHKEENDVFTIKQASEWASKYLQRTVTPSNISYLIQYGRVARFDANGDLLIRKKDLLKYYDSYLGRREDRWKNKLGNDLDWGLSFDHLRESDTTKHVHRLHPYKGKFIPQLVGYFLDNHLDDFKRQVYFDKGDIILDPFAGSGTTLVQANELGMHAVGVDISAFNSLISNVKVGSYDFKELFAEIQKISQALKLFVSKSEILIFDQKLLEELERFNNKYFPVPGYKTSLRKGKINESLYGQEKENLFLPVFKKLILEYKIDLRQDKTDKFLDKWYLRHIREEIEFVHRHVQAIKDENVQKVVSIVLSRTIRSCRATTHSDLATLKEPVDHPYYCAKHGKVCKPLFSLMSWWERYGEDTINRLTYFNKIRTATHQACLTGDARTIDLFAALDNQLPALGRLARKKKIRGIFSSPPYVGLIDYHEQHAYAYNLFGFERNDDLEIGPLCKGQGADARASYVEGISKVLTNCRRFLTDDFDAFLVANDKYDLYPSIVEKAGMTIVNQFKRPVLNRTERDKSPYSEIIFHIKNGK